MIRCAPALTGATTTIPDIDIWRSANLYVRRYGADAEVQAAIQADLLLEAGDMDGAAVWRRTKVAIAVLQRREPEARV